MKNTCRDRFVAAFLCFVVLVCTLRADDFTDTAKKNLDDNNRATFRSTATTHNGTPVQIPHTIATIGSVTGVSKGFSTVLENSHIFKAGAGTLVELVVINTGPAQIVQIFDSATLPANGTAPMLPFYVPTTANGSFTCPITAVPMDNGMVVCNSSTVPTKTIGAADCWFFATYK